MSATVGQLVERACVLEARTPKPGNVHPGASFANLTYEDLVASAAAIRPVFDRASSQSIGATVLEAITRTRRRIGTNTNLGIVLLLAPLARVPRVDRLTTDEGREALRSTIREVLRGTTIADAEQVYEAIRLARPGGLGRVNEADVRSPPTGTLFEMMRLAMERDLLARQYVNAYREVVHESLPLLERTLKSGAGLERSIVMCFLDLIARHGDSLISRKCGEDVSKEAGRRARDILEKGWPDRQAGIRALVELDGWLRQDGHRRNPGTSADLVVAVLFLAMRGGIIPEGVDS